MSRSGIDRLVAGRSGGSAIHLITHGLAACALLVVLAPSPAHAQFGRLKKLKEKFSAPDSAARAKDSLEQIAAGVKPESVKVGKSMLQRGASMVSTANGAIESATGISAKDAALAATGVGAGNLVAKKLGLDPFSIGAQALANAKMSAQQRAMQAGGVMPGAGATSAMAGKAGMMDAASMAAMQRAAMGNAVASTKANRAAMASAMAGSAQAGTFTQADAAALLAFQQEMMQVSMAASAGDAGARARLEAWQAIAMKYQAEAQRLSLAAGTGDMAAVQKLQQLQLDMVRDWTRTGTTKAAKRVK